MVCPAFRRVILKSVGALGAHSPEWAGSMGQWVNDFANPWKRLLKNMAMHDESVEVAFYHFGILASII